jgi:Type IV secretion-system coupling protein DNA-binding domain
MNVNIPQLQPLVEKLDQIDQQFGSWLFFAGALVIGAIGFLWMLMRKTIAPEQLMFSILDDELSIEEGCQNFLITGGIGSGKTNALNYLLHSLTVHQPKWGGLWLDNKGNSEADLRAVLESQNRHSDAIVLRARSQGREPTHFYNVMNDPAFTPEALGFAIMEVTSGSPNNHSGDFFQKQGALHIAKAIHALRAMGRHVSFTTIYPILTDANSTKRFIAELQAFPKKAPVKATDFRPDDVPNDPATAPYFDHFQNTFIAMPPDQFGGVIGTIQNALSPFQTPEVAEVFAAENQPQSFHFADLEAHKVLCISLPQIYPQERYALNVLFKHLFYQYAMTRYDLPAEKLQRANVLALWLDEAQHSLRKGDWGDYRFLDRLRAAKCCAVLAMQDHTSAYPVLGKDVAIVTMAQLRNRLIFSAPTFESAEISANFIGKIERMKVTKGTNAGRTSVSRTPHDEYKLKPEAISGLKNHRCHLYLANKTLRKNRKLPRCQPK